MIRQLLSKLFGVIGFLASQVYGFFRNVWTWLTVGFRLKDVIVPTLYNSLVWLTKQVPLAFGFGSATQQLEASIVLGVATFFTGAVTGGLAWAIIGLWVATAVVAVLRFIPVVEAHWPLSKIQGAL